MIKFFLYIQPFVKKILVFLKISLICH